MKVFGRDPALWMALLASLISAAGAMFHLSIDAEGALNGFVAAVFGIIVWRVTHDGGPALILGLVKAGIVLAAAFHFNLPTATQAIIMSVVSAAVAMFVRTQVGAPVAPPALTASPVTVVETPTT